MSAVLASITPPRRPFSTIAPPALDDVRLDLRAADPEIERDAVGHRDRDAEQRRARASLRPPPSIMPSVELDRPAAPSRRTRADRARMSAVPARTGCTRSRCPGVALRSATPSQSLSRPSPQISGVPFLTIALCRRSRPARRSGRRRRGPSCVRGRRALAALVGEPVAVVILAVAGTSAAPGWMFGSCRRSRRRRCRGACRRRRRPCRSRRGTWRTSRSRRARRREVEELIGMTISYALNESSIADSPGSPRRRACCPACRRRRGRTRRPRCRWRASYQHRDGPRVRGPIAFPCTRASPGTAPWACCCCRRMPDEKDPSASFFITAGN